MMDGHINDEEFAALLLGEGEERALQHVRACAACGGELERVGGAVQAWSRMSLAGAAERAAEVRPAAVREAALRWRPEPSWWAAAAAGVVAVVLLGSGVLRIPAHGGPAVAGAKQQVQEDDQLLSNIDAELRWQQGGAVQMPAGSLRGRASEGGWQ